MIVSNFNTMTCSSCSFNDGMCYTSLPPKYRCTFDNQFYDGMHACHLDLAPVRHGKILQCIKNGKFNRVFSCCDTDCTTMTSWIWPKYCPWCGAKLDGDKNETN